MTFANETLFKSNLESMKKMLKIFAKSRNVVITSMLLSVMMFSLAPLSGQTNVSDTVYGTWTLAESPYMVDSTIVIPNDSTLTIEPGVVVEFQGKYKLNVQGRLVAVGTSDNMITFTSNPSFRDTSWNGIRFDYTQMDMDSSMLKYCIFEYGNANAYTVGDNINSDDDNLGGAIYVAYYSKLIIENSIFRYNKSVGCGGAIKFDDNASALVKNCIFHDNVSGTNGGAINAKTNSPLVIVGNKFYNNKAGVGGALMIGNASSPENIIMNNIFANNEANERGGAVTLGKNNQNYFVNNTVVNNLSNFGGGLFLGENGTSLEGYNNIFYGNKANAAGDQVFFGMDDGDIGDADFYNNILQGGLEGIPGYGLEDNIYDTLYDADPMFVSPISGIGYSDEAASADWSLMQGSPAIDLGDTISYLFTYDVDIMGNPRIYNDNRVDLGAIEYQGDPENRLPILFSSYNDLSLQYGKEIQLAVDYSELDEGDVASINVTSDNSDVSIANLSGDTTHSVFNIEVAQNANGMANIAVTVTDESGLISSLNSDTFKVFTGTVVELCDTIRTDLTIDADIVMVNCNVLVDTMVTLTIKPGTRVEFQGYYSISSQGRIIAEGTEEEPILFTAANQDSGWHAIRYEYTPDYNYPSVFSYCTFEYGKALGSGEPDVAGGAVIIRGFKDISFNNCVFRDNYANKSGAGLLVNDEGNVDIDNCHFYDNLAIYGGGGIQASDDASISISNSLFENNIALNPGGGVKISGGTQAVIDNCIFRNNTTGKNGGGLAVNEDDVDSSRLVLTNSLFEGNVSKNHGGNLAVFYNASARILNNTFRGGVSGNSGGNISIHEDSYATIIDNTIEGGTAKKWGAGIFVNNYSNATIVGNTITGNSGEGGSGVIYHNTSKGLLENNIIQGNSSSKQGGGVSIKDRSEVMVAGNIISNNHTDGKGGGIHVCRDAIVEMVTNKITGNTALNGGGISLCGDKYPNAELYMYSNLIAQNSAIHNGGGIYVNYDVSLYAYNNTIADNEAGLLGGAVSISPAIDTLIFKDCIFGGNVAGNLGSQILSESDTLIALVNNLFEQGSDHITFMNITSPSIYEQKNIMGEVLFSGSVTEPYFLAPNATDIEGSLDVTEIMPYRYDLSGNERFQGRIEKGAYEQNNYAPFFLEEVFEFSIDENSADATVVGTAVSDDYNNDMVDLSIALASIEGAFDMAVSSGQITVANQALLDYETNPTFTLGVNVLENNTELRLSGDAQVIISLNDVNEAPVFGEARVEIFTDRWAANGSSISTANPASDEDGDVLTYSMTDASTPDIFEVDPATGEVLVTDASQLADDALRTVTFTLVASDGEFSVEIPAIIHIVATGVYQLQSLKDIRLYPNPALDMINIQGHGVKEMNISVITPEGRVVTNEIFNAPEATLSLSGLNSGVYMVKIQTENGTVIKRLIKR